MKDLTLQLTINDANTVLRALSNMPYHQVNTLIEKIQQQAREQLGQTNGVTHATEQN